MGSAVITENQSQDKRGPRKARKIQQKEGKEKNRRSNRQVHHGTRNIRGRYSHCHGLFASRVAHERNEELIKDIVLKKAAGLPRSELEVTKNFC